MTTYFPVSPNGLTPPTFQPTLDGAVYLVIVKWNLFANRYYAECHNASDDDLVFNIPIVETPPGLSLSSLSFNDESLTMMATTVAPHNIPVGMVANLTVESATPSSLNGEFPMLSTSDDTLTYSFPAGANINVVSPGVMSYLFSLTDGYFESTMIYRNGQIEISP